MFSHDSDKLFTFIRDIHFESHAVEVSCIFNSLVNEINLRSRFHTSSFSSASKCIPTLPERGDKLTPVWDNTQRAITYGPLGLTMLLEVGA